MLDITGDIAANILEPNSEEVDLEGPHLVEGRMHYASKTYENIEATRKAGLWGISMPRRYGGLNMPITPYTQARRLENHEYQVCSLYDEPSHHPDSCRR